MKLATYTRVLVVWSSHEKVLIRLALQVVFPVTKYDPPVPWWASIYCLVQFFVVLFSFQHLAKLESSMPYLAALGMVLFFMYSLTCFGMIFDHL